MSSQSSGNPDSSSQNTSIPQRRASITEYFRPPQPTSAYPGPITTAAAQANHRRRMSYSGGITGTSPTPAWVTGYVRRGSVSSASSTASSPTMDDEDKAGSAGANGNSDASEGLQRGGSFARRLSFGARALRDVKRNMNIGVVGEGEPSSPTALEALQRRESMPLPGDSMPPPSVPASEQRKTTKGPDEIQERILKGDFYY